MTMLARFLSCTRGAAAAEMALILPISVLLLFTSVEGAHYLYQQHQVVKAVRDGARYAARHSFDDINCRSGPSIDTTLESNIKNVTRTGKITGGSPRIASWSDAEVTVSVTCPTLAASPESQTGIFRPTEPAPQVNVSARVDYDSLFNGLGVLTDSASLNAAQQAVVMGI